MVGGKNYRNSNPACTYDIRVLKVSYADDTRIKIKFWFIKRTDGSLVSLIIEKATINREDLQYWKEISHGHND